MPSWLVTGGAGFLGRHVVSELMTVPDPDLRVVIAGRTCPIGGNPERFHELDLRDRATLAKLIAEVRPSLVFHLAGKTPPGTPDEFDEVNISITIDLLKTLEYSGHPCRVVLIGSAAELGPVPVEQLPVGEDYPCQPSEPYGWSKWRATLAGLTVSPPVEVVVARVFNPIGPGISTFQALGRFAHLLAKSESPVRLIVGDLEARRDFVDVRDVAAAVVELAVRGSPGEVYHIGTGQSHTVREGLDRFVALSGRDVTIEVAPAFARSRGPADSRADISKIRAYVGWAPRISWEQSLNDLWNDVNRPTRAGLTDPGPSV